MNSISFSRRSLLKFMPAGLLVALVGTGSAKAALFEKNPVKRASTVDTSKKNSTTFMLNVLSLIPNTPASIQSAAIVKLDIGQSLELRSQVGLPLIVQLERDKPNALLVDDYYAINILNESGVLLDSMVVSNNTTATFVNEQVQFYLRAFS